MKKSLFIPVFLIFGNFLFGQNQNLKEEYVEPISAITVGFLHGGGSLVGADLEFLVTENFGLQVGGGFVGWGAGLNYHLKPGIRSSFLSFQYWHQGLNETFAQDAAGAVFVFRGKKWFTFTLGMGAPLSKGPAFPDNLTQPPVMLLYAIGAYFPF